MDQGDIQILIVDDEPEARELLKYILQEREGLTVCGLAANVDEGIELLEARTPDLVFLDIQMPGKDGFQFIEYVKQSRQEPGIIFVTAFDHYAIQAIRKSVFDYIMKPVRQEALFSAIDRFREDRGRERNSELANLLDQLQENKVSKIKLNTRTGYVLLHPGEVVFCEADGNYTEILLEGGNREIITQNLSSIEVLLDKGTFFRASRSYLINIKYLSRVERKNATCILEHRGQTIFLKIPSHKIKLLEASFG